MSKIGIGNIMPDIANLPGQGGRGGGFENEYSMNFDGIDAFIVSTLDLSGVDFSISFWIKSTDTTVDTKPICITSTTSAPNTTIGRYYNNRGFMMQTFDDTGGSFGNYYADYDVNDGNWHNIIFTKVHDATLSNNKIRIYIDGNNYVWTSWSGASTTPTLTWKPPSIAPFITGLYSRNSGAAVSYAWDGNLDEIVIKTGTIWGDAEATDIFNSGTPKDMSGYAPTSWIRMGEEATWDGSKWTLVDQGSHVGVIESSNMIETDRQLDTP